MAQNVVWLGLILGIISTSVLHLAKAMERHGIETLSRDISLKEKGKKPIIYIVGLILNNSNFIWQIIALQYVSAVVFSSVFGLGLVVLLLYSHYFLHENIKQIELLGAALIIIGTTMVGFIQITEPLKEEIINFSRLYSLLIIISIIFSILIIFSAKTNIAVAIIFGSIAGSFGGLDNVFKRIGLMDGISEVFNIQTLPLFLLSFFVGFLAFLVTQWGFTKKAKASKLVPMYNSFYIIIPIIFELVIISGATLSILKMLSIIIIIIGIFLMNLFKNSNELERKIERSEK